MLEKKKIAVLVAAAMLVAACGGGGGDGSSSTTAVNTSATGNRTATDTTGSGTTTTGTGSGTSTGGSTGSGTAASPATDQQLAGYLALVAEQLVYIKRDRSIYFPVGLTDFEGATGMYDFASGSKDGDATAPVPASAIAPAAPLAAFGFRVEKVVQRTSASQAVANQTVVGRVAFELTELPGSQGIGAGEVAESMKFVIDKVELQSDANGELTSARALDGAQLYVYGRNAAGVEVRETLPVPAGSVRLLPLWQLLDHEGDTTSIVLLVDLENAFSQAGSKLAALENIAGHFSMQATLSSVPLVRPATATVAQRNLVGQSITVNSQPAVSGGGVSGSAWVRMYPPQ
ncbi:hypothetical protein SAMN06265795_11668 [Noviherbaspirillum humi]|uniref:Uncharacterized protein n=1 Tax=Noviherbaspirillum humi TaxID=1688639 RepID=A0A239KLI6_9BURK|nr:hypothetical protein [Noviherbaspirillum humi]SNT18860.1 hypothetical protein SAMN06265795_11668 [Noviherbaspirillum humi]